MSVQVIREGFEETLNEINILDGKLAEEYSAIEEKAFIDGRELSNDEINHLRQISARQDKLADLTEILALDTIDALENSSDVDALLDKIEGVNQQLEDDLDRLQQIEENAQKVQKVAEGLAKIVEKLIEFKQRI